MTIGDLFFDRPCDLNKFVEPGFYTLSIQCMLNR